MKAKDQAAAEEDTLTGNPRSAAKYKQIYALLRQSILNGTYLTGTKLPSENELVEQFAASRPTVGRALAQLESEGLIQRRAGSGTFVSPRARPKNQVFGLLIPDLGVTDIFEPICQGISQARLGGRHDLIWGPLFDRDAPRATQAERLCEYYLTRDLSGIFFAPLEFSEDKDLVNLRVASRLEQAGIPLVLLDRDIVEYPKRSRHDLIGIDNHRAGLMITEHLLARGARRLVFFSPQNSAPTVNIRLMGFYEAIRRHDGPIARGAAVFSDPANLDGVRQMYAEYRPDAIMCANDHTAARLMPSLRTLGVQIPGEVRVTGIDDAKYASLLQTPLTTIRQPCAEIGSTALMAMYDRVAHPEMAARDLFVDFELIIRESSAL